jgi:soluble lytic murein transglycosylase-like protein
MTQSVPVVVLLAALTLRGQDPRQAMEAAAEKQRAAIAAMTASIEKQKASVRRQAQDFFVETAAVQVRPECPPLSKDEASPMVEKSAGATGLMPSVIWAVMEQESAYYPCAVSRAGAQGLMQLMPDTARSLGVTDPMDPEQNVRAGSRYLKELLDRYGGNLVMALAAYNAGPTRVDEYGGLPPITETGRYVDQVLRRVMGDRPAQSQSPE